MINLKPQNLLVLFILLLFSTSGNCMKIEGTILNFEEKELSVNILFGQWYMESDEMAIAIDSQGRFVVDLEIKEIRNARLKIGDQEIQLMLKPNEQTLTIQLDYLDFKNSLKFTGTLALENKFFNERNHLGSFKKFEELSPELSVNPFKLDELFDKELNNDLTSLEGIQKYVVEVNYNFIKEEVKAYYLMLKIWAGVQQGFRSLETYEKNWRGRNDSLIQLINCKVINHHGLNYSRLIGTYYYDLQNKYYTDISRDSLFWFEQFEVDSREELMEALGKDENNKKFFLIAKLKMCKVIFEKALSNRIYQSLEYGDYENLNFLYNEFVKRYPKSSLLEKLESRMEKVFKFEAHKDRTFPGIHFYSIDRNFDSLKEIIAQEEFKNKVVVIDIWGTWCGSCREEFQHLGKLKSKLPKGELAYLYLSHEKVRNPEAHWKETVRFFELTGYHYILNKKVLKDFWNWVDPNQRLRKYPTYMILNRDGTVAVHEAHLPSEGDKLYEQIMEVVSRK